MLSSKKTGRIALFGVFTALAFILGFIESLLPSFTGIPGVKAGFANIVTMAALYLFSGPTSSSKQQRPGQDLSIGETAGSPGIPKETALELHPTFTGYISALAISTVRILLGGISYSGMNAMLYGLAGAVVSLTVMFLLSRLRIFSITAISVAGGTAHNLAQLFIAYLMLGNAVVYYLPVLIISGLAAGIIIGVISAALIRRLSFN